MVEIYSKYGLELFYFNANKLWQKSYRYSYVNPFAAKYATFNKLFILKGYYGFGQESLHGGWRALDQNEI